MMEGLKKNIGFLKSKFIYEWNFVKRKRKRLFYNQFIKPGNLCIDVGAHLGDRSDTWLNLGARVVAVDPQPMYYDYLMKKFGGNKNIAIEKLALTDKVGKAEMHLSHLHPTVSSLSSEKWRKGLIDASTSTVAYDEIISVDTNTLDNLILKYGHANFIKIDVEGFEYEVLSGFTRPSDYLSFEFLSFNLDNLEKCLDYLEGIGYKYFNWSYAETFKMDSTEWLSKAGLLQRINQFSKKSFSGDVYTKLK